MNKGYIGKILFVDLTTGKIEENLLSEEFYRSFLGGYGLGVRILYERMKANTDPLGPDNIIGFAPGILTATGAPMSSRYEVFAKSPLTNAWAQGNSGGYFANELKKTGYDAVFFNGTSHKPVYLLIQEDKAELRDAAHIWGKDTVETQNILQDELRDKSLRVACIGPAGESLSLISCVINEGGRAAARSGTGAIMGAKLLKAIAVRGNKKMTIAEPKRLNILRTNFLKSINDSQDFLANVLKNYGTCGTFFEFIAGGDAPIKNWSLQGIENFPNAAKIHKDNVIKYQIKKFACHGCPVGCGGIVEVNGGSYSVTEGHKPEYESLASFGSLCMNDDIESIIKATDICNRFGFDTLSAGTTIAFAIECYENNIINKKETDGIELTWGNAAAIVETLLKLARREGFGNILADGVRKAANRIGRGAEKYAIHVSGEEPGCRDARFVAGRGIGYIADPAPGRHTASTLQTVFEQGAPLGNYPELRSAQKEFKGGKLSSVANKYQTMVSSAGLCTFSAFFTYPAIEFISAVTGWDFTAEEALRIGHRIKTLQQAFIIRDGISPNNFQMPDRMSRMPTDGPLAGVSHNFDSLRRDFFEAMGWDESGHPLESTLKQLELDDLVAKFGG